MGLIFSTTISAFSSAITAFAVVRWLLRFVQNHTFESFGWYRVVLGVAILLLVH